MFSATVYEEADRPCAYRWVYEVRCAERIVARGFADTKWRACRAAAYAIGA
jgi:hypothetical protein